MNDTGRARDLDADLMRHEGSDDIRVVLFGTINLRSK